ncbi:CLUMA_CG005643, isoform A [Clunio marinus]|uniref:CLUMA_CG005643, isoform A n=1 Tax=Clunio marinus TaxID=568069 RepID=A0A1J1HVG0_9DIPT|nr:CLUMA_CG005643, isoform A [Clunio marinus]
MSYFMRHSLAIPHHSMKIGISTISRDLILFSKARGNQWKTSTKALSSPQNDGKKVRWKMFSMLKIKRNFSYIQQLKIHVENRTEIFMAYVLW